MATLLWGFGQFMVDPSTHVLQDLLEPNQNHSLRVLNQNMKYDQSEENISDEIDEMLSELEKKMNTAEKPNTLSVETKMSLSYHSLGVQSCEEVKREVASVAVQCSRVKSTRKLVHAGTCVSGARLRDRCAGPSTASVALNRDAETSTDHQQLCDHHRKILHHLKHWSKHSYQLSHPTNLVASIKSLFKDFVNYFRIDKIENIPYFFNSPSRNFKMYRTASFDDFLKDNYRATF